MALCIEAGKPIKDSRGEAGRLVDTFRVAAEESVRMIGEVMPLDARIARQLLLEATGQMDKNQSVSLTEREKEVLGLVARGLSNKALAETLALTEGTVKIHVSRILSKLDVSSRTEAAIRAVQLGLVSADGPSPTTVRHLA